MRKVKRAGVEFVVGSLEFVVDVQLSDPGLRLPLFFPGLPKHDLI